MDILLMELGSGGEIQVRNKDIVTVGGYENQPYIACFGGSEWLFNGLLVHGNAQFTSKTEDVLKNTPLTSSGLIDIENAISDDLQYLEDITGTAVTVDARIINPNRLDVYIGIDGQTFYFNYNPDSAFLNYGLIE